MRKVVSVPIISEEKAATNSGKVHRKPKRHHRSDNDTANPEPCHPKAATRDYNRQEQDDADAKHFHDLPPIPVSPAIPNSLVSHQIPSRPLPALT